ncbi:hypothetical protein LVJ94_03680 [Pendulispora rubella]|uniref:Uncharacterized protein n=1 Tax=Pendulispora rubella TaxID=2741070 RepID=A0ABZ2L949_9BACT
MSRHSSFFFSRMGVISLGLLGVLGCRPEEEPKTAAPPDWLETQANDEGKVMSSDQHGQRMGDVLRGIALRQDDHEEWTVELDGRRCYWFSGAGDETVKGMSLYLRDPDNRRASRRHERTSSRVLLEYCPRVSGSYRLQAKVTSGHGHFAVTIFRSDVGEKSEDSAAK